MTQSQLPAHLQKYQAPDVGAALSQNLGSAMPPHVSIEGGRFTLVDASNNEIPVPTFDPKIGVYLDAAIIDVNEHMSRMFYLKPYDPSAAGAPPDCWSDNGIAASIGASAVPLLEAPHPRAGQPAATCTECPMAVWGSKVSAQGKNIPACSQKQKTALLVPGFSTLFLLAVPPNSHKFLREYVERSRGSDVNLADVITRISFVPGVQGTLQFAPVNYIDEPTAILRQAAYTEKKTDALVGRNDVPRSSGLLAAPVQQTVIPNMQAGVGDLNQPMPVPQIAQQQVFQPAPQVQPQTFVPPAAAAPAPTASGQFQNPSATSTIPNTAAPAGGVTTASPSEPAPTPRRRRRTAAEMQAAQPSQPAPAAAQAAPQQPAQMPQAPFPHPTQLATAPQQLDAFPTASGAPAHPSTMAPQPQFGMAQGQSAGANPEVNAMLDNFFKQG